MQESSNLDSSHIQIKFFTKDQSFTDRLPKQVFNVPISSGSEQLNILINKIGETTENDKWTKLKFDFLIDSVLLRVSLLDFIDGYKLSLENVLELECIEQSPAPVPYLDLSDSEWVADVKTINEKCIVSVNYGGEFILWNIDRTKDKTIAKRNVVKKLDEEPIKCLDVFSYGKTSSFLVGAQNQTLILMKMEGAVEKSHNIVEKAVLRGHERSVECVAINNDGTRAVSGSFDKCIKVWNISEDQLILNSDQIESFSASSKGSKRAKIDDFVTKTPMVTLQAHREAVVDIKWNTLNYGQAVSVSWDKQILLWDLEHATPTTSLPSNRAFSALSINHKNGIVLTSSTDSFIRMWDLRSKEGSMVKNTYCGHLAWVSDVCWSPFNEYLFSSSSFDGTVKMWDARSPKAALYDLMGHQDRVLCVDWSISERIASGSVDCSVKVFSC